MKDFVGREIKVGCTVVYPYLSGRRINMRQATVVRVEENRLVVTRGSSPIYLTALRHVVVVRTVFPTS